MFYKVSMILFFPDKKTAEKSIEKAVAQLPLAISINVGEPREERSFIIIEECYHDEHPSKPCEIIASYNP